MMGSRYFQIFKARSNNMGKEDITKRHPGKLTAKRFLFKGINYLQSGLMRGR